MPKKIAKKSPISKTALTSKKKAAVQQKKVGINYVFPPEQNMVYSNNVTVQGDGTVFQISFFHIQPPIIIGTDEEMAEKIGKITNLDAICVSKVLVPANLMPLLIGALQTNVDKQMQSNDFIEIKGS